MRHRIGKELVKRLVPAEKPYEVVDTELKGFLLRVQPSGSMTYYFAYRNKEARKKRFRIGKHGMLTAPQARDVAKKMALRVASGEDIQEEKNKARIDAAHFKSRTLRGFLENKYGPWVIVHLKEGSAVTTRIERRFSFILDKPMVEVTAWKIEKWRSERLKAGVSKATTNRDLTYLKACLNKAVQWGIIKSHQLNDVKQLRVDSLHRVRYLSSEEEKRLRTTLNERDDKLRTRRKNHRRWRKKRGYSVPNDFDDVSFPDHLHPMVLLSMNTGMRRGELTSLKWSDLDLDQNTIRVRGSITKSGITRYIPLSREAAQTLVHWRASSDESSLVFPGKDGTKLKSLKTAWGSLLKQADIQDFRWHDLRHHFASSLVMSGVDLNTVRELLGHQSLEMTLRYTHLSKDHKHAAIEKLNEVKHASTS